MPRPGRIGKPEDVQLDIFPRHVLELLGRNGGDLFEFAPLQTEGGALLRVQISRHAEGFGWRVTAYRGYRAALRSRGAASVIAMRSAGEALTAAADRIRFMLEAIPADDRQRLKAWLGGIYTYASQMPPHEEGLTESWGLGGNHA